MTVAAYLASRTRRQRSALAALRRTIKTAAPGSTEVIAYGIPTVKLDGRALVAYSAGGRTGKSEDCALYTMSLATFDKYRAAAGAHAHGKGTFRFTPDDPLPASLVTKVVKARIAEAKR